MFVTGPVDIGLCGTFLKMDLISCGSNNGQSYLQSGSGHISALPNAAKTLCPLDAFIQYEVAGKPHVDLKPIYRRGTGACSYWSAHSYLNQLAVDDANSFRL
jgi:hypothetical protein